MARVELEDSWNVEGDVDAVRAQLRRFCAIHKMRRVEEHDDEFQVAQGSQLLTRLLGGWFVPATWLPKRATILLRPGKRGVRVEALIEEAMGFGLLDPILKKKYQKYFEDWMDRIRDFTS